MLLGWGKVYSALFNECGYYIFHLIQHFILISLLNLCNEGIYVHVLFRVMILDGVDIKDVSKYWIVFMYSEHYMSRLFIIIMNVTSDIAQDQILILVIMVE